MKVIPAIDIKNGKCVRLKKGNFSDITLYSGSPLEQARLFKDNGFDFIHVIDLDGAKKGERINNRISETKGKEQRKDDNAETLLNRIEVFKTSTLPIVRYYEEKGIISKIDGMQKVNEVYAKITKIIC